MRRIERIRAFADVYGFQPEDFGFDDWSHQEISDDLYEDALRVLFADGKRRSIRQSFENPNLWLLNHAHDVAFPDHADEMKRRLDAGEIPSAIDGDVS
jgi:chromosome condensin MukBEF complex kleisin-like MukF subunit